MGEDPATVTPYIVMEYVEGKTLEELGSSQRLQREHALGLIHQVAEALDYAHSQQIIHRDIKPANILVTVDTRAKITDFGIGKVTTSQFTQTGQILGTPSYLSPEQLTGQNVDGRADLFALGTVLYWALTGEKPFAGESMATLTFKIVYSEPLPPTKLNPALGADSDYVINRALAKDPNRRYQRGRAFADDIDDLLAGQPPRSRSVLRTPAPSPESPARRLAPLAAAPVPKTEPLRSSPLAELSAVDRLWARVRSSSFLLLGVPLGLTLLLLLMLSAWWLLGYSTQSQVSDGGTSGVEPAGRAASPGPAVTAVVPAAATLRVRGENPFNDATLYAYADGKLLRRARLRRKSDDEKFTLEVTLPAGRRKISIRVEESGKGFDQTSAIDGQFGTGQTRTLEVDFQRQLKSLGRRRFVLRWLD